MKKVCKTSACAHHLCATASMLIDRRVHEVLPDFQWVNKSSGAPWPEVCSRLHFTSIWLSWSLWLLIYFLICFCQASTVYATAPSNSKAKDERGLKKQAIHVCSHRDNEIGKAMGHEREVINELFNIRWISDDSSGTSSHVERSLGKRMHTLVKRS